MSENIAQLSIKKRWNTKVSFLQPRPVRLVKTGYYNEQYENIVSDRTRIDNALYDLSCQMKDLQSDYKDLQNKQSKRGNYSKNHTSVTYAS